MYFNWWELWYREREREGEEEREGGLSYKSEY